MRRIFIPPALLFLALVAFLKGIDSMAQAGKMSETLDSMKRKVSIMKAWAESMKLRMNVERKDSLLSFIEKTADSVGIKLESAKPVEREGKEAIEITMRKISAEKLLKFIWRVEKEGDKFIGRLKVRRDISTPQFLDIEMEVTR